MNAPEFIAVLEGFSGVLMAGTWYWVLRRHDTYASWRRRASLVALMLPSAALAIGLVLAATVHVRSLEAIDTATLRGGWHAFAGRLWVGALLATGALSLGGLALAAVSKGSPRFAAAVWSFFLLGLFFVNFTLAVNSFH